MRHKRLKSHLLTLALGAALLAAACGVPQDEPTGGGLASMQTFVDKGVVLSPDRLEVQEKISCEAQGCVVAFRVCAEVLDGTPDPSMANLGLELSRGPDRALLAAYGLGGPWGNCADVAYRAPAEAPASDLSDVNVELALHQRDLTVKLSFSGYSRQPAPMCDPGREDNKDRVTAGGFPLAAARAAPASTYDIVQAPADAPFRRGAKETFDGFSLRHAGEIDRFWFAVDAPEFFHAPTIRVKAHGLFASAKLSLRYQPAGEGTYSFECTAGVPGPADCVGTVGGAGSPPSAALKPDAANTSDESGYAFVSVRAADWQAPEGCRQYSLEISVE